MRRHAALAGTGIPVLCILAMLGAEAGAGAKGGTKMKPGITKQDFGKAPDGTVVDLYTLTNAKGMTAKIMTYGGIVTELHTPDRDGKLENIVLGFDNLKDY